MPSPTRKLQAGLLLLSAVAAASDSVPTTTRGRVAFIAGLPTGTSLHPGRCSAKAGQPSRGRILRMGALPPDDSPYAKPEEERPFWGTDYVPKEGHVGSMPPGTRLEDKPMEELAPVSNIPYPHFQEWPFHYRFPAYQPRRLDFIEWMTRLGLMVEDDGDSKGVRFLGRKRRFRNQAEQETNVNEAAEEERRAILDLEGDFWGGDAGELMDPEQYIFEQAKTKRVRIPYIVKLREAKAKEAAALAGAAVDEIGS